MELSEFIYEAKSVGLRNITRYVPVPHEDFWRTANEKVILVVWDAEEAEYYSALQLIEGTKIRILSQKEAYHLDHFEWRNSTKFYSFNPVVGAL